MRTAPPTSLPGTGTDPEALIQEARRRQRRRYLLSGLAAVLVLAGGAGIAVSQITPAGSSPGRVLADIPGAGASAGYASAPAYYAYAAQGTFTTTSRTGLTTASG